MGGDPTGNDGDNDQLIDWKGMNVIFEFGNTANNLCALNNFAQSWLDLSAMPFYCDTPPCPAPAAGMDFNAALEAITLSVIHAGAAPNCINGSALSRIRTNQRIFEPVQSGLGAKATWAGATWRLAQFEFDPNTTIGTNGTHPLMGVPMTNTPQIDANSFTHITQDPNSPTITSVPASAALINWVFSNSVALSTGSHILPNSYTVPGTSNTFTLAPIANVNNQLGHFWDLNWATSTTDAPYYWTIPPGGTNATARELRRQLSINTCQGCHGGENKTFFNHVRPVGYGVKEEYWNSIPDGETGTVDLRFVKNGGTSGTNGIIPNPSTDPYELAAHPFLNRSVYPLLSNDLSYTNTSKTMYVQYVSPFLTGVLYNGSDYQDDWSGDDASLSFQPDNNLNGQYYVFDPADSAMYDNAAMAQVDNTMPNPDKMNAYNDLLLRKQAMCKQLSFNPCSRGFYFSNVLLILNATSQTTYSE